MSCAPTSRRPPRAGRMRPCCGWIRAIRCWPPTAGWCSAPPPTWPTSRRRMRCFWGASRTAATWGIRGGLQAPDDPDARAEVVNLRSLGPIFDDISSQLVSAAVALLNWHERARFSSVDGSPTRPARAGWSRVNPVTGHEEFPRIDPAVICLVHDGGDRAVLARQAVWPERMFSLLAGFVEAGESFEVCVAREIREEIGLTVRGVRYLGSQPWPFPRSLMVGFHAVGDPAEEFRSTTARSPRRPGSPATRYARRWPRGLVQRVGVESPAARVDLDRPRDHRILGRDRLTRALSCRPRPASPSPAPRSGWSASTRRRTSPSEPSCCRR